MCVRTCGHHTDLPHDYFINIGSIGKSMTSEPSLKTYSLPPTFMRMLSRKSLYLLGIGAGSALGTYLYRNPKVRKDLRNAESVSEAANTLASHMKEDAMETAHAMSDSVADNMKKTKKTLGQRFFGRGKSNARIGLKHIKNEATHLTNVAKNEARHASGALKNEMSRLKNEAGEAKDLAANQISK